MFTKKPEREGGDSGTPRSSDLGRPFGERAAAGSRPATPISTPSSSPAVTTSYSKAVPSIIGEDLKVVGNIISKGEIQVDGEVEGDVRCVSLLLGDKSRVTGRVIADDVVVRGSLNGSIRGLRVTLQAQSRVEGDIYHQSLSIEQGAYFEGKSRRSEDPVSVPEETEAEAKPETSASTPAASTPFAGFGTPADTNSNSTDSKADAAE